MDSPLALQAGVENKPSRVPGGFDGDDDIYNEEHSDHLSSLLPAPHESSGLLRPFDENSNAGHISNTVLEEREMNKKLMDVESSFLPELSHLATGDGQARGADDTFAFGVPNDNLVVRRKPPPVHISKPSEDFKKGLSEESVNGLRSPQTPPGSYKTPAPEQQILRQLEDEENESPDSQNTLSLETMSSSPTAAAAARTVHRVQSIATMGGYETADERADSASPTGGGYDGDDMDVTPRKPEGQRSPGHSPTRSKLGMDGNASSLEDNTEDSERRTKRPKYLNSRASHQRLSQSSLASTATDTSDATLGADFALQSGGALPEPRRQRRPKMTLSRSTSLGSIVSGISNMSDDESKSKKSTTTGELSTLEEERPQSNQTQKNAPTGLPETPRVAGSHLSMPTDTVIANNVRNLEIPGTFARQYRQQNRSSSPVKTSLTMAGMTPGPKRGMTLKEHSSTVERLGKENFDLKMKIHFLDQALQRRSEDGVKEMITENVQLKSDRMRLEKDNHNLRKQVRDLQKKLDATGARDSPGADQGYGTDEERSPTTEEEVIYLRERVETNEIEIEKLRTESLLRETEKRRLAEMVRSLGDTRGGVSDVGSREERDMWKDMLEAETIAREQSDEDNKRLREEIAKLRSETFGQNKGFMRKPQPGESGISRSSSTDGGRNGIRSEPAELERLRHEVSELQKTIGAQASQLTSRNKEKERLYQEIEDLKIGRMGGNGVRSVAGDSIFERSASRARSNSRASNGTRFSRLSEPERDSLEIKIGELRDQASELKLENQHLKGQLDEVLAELDAVDAQAQADADQFNEELHLLTIERDDALQAADEQDVAFQNLKAEAQEEIDGLGDELDAKIEESTRLEQDLKTQSENVKALQAEMRSASEGLIRLEEDAQQNLARYKAVQGELDDANRELENLEKNLSEANSKVQRLTVQQESSHNEIAFLREEQDGDKIKIGDMESLLKKVHLNLDSERDKGRELDRRLTEERQQRESVSSQEKQDVQRVINDLNREASAAKEELRRLKKTMSAREIEASTWKERLTELEDSLRHSLGDKTGTRATLLSSVTRMQRELDQSNVDLEATRRRLDEKEALLATRDALLESSGLEYRKIGDLLDRERQARRQDKHSFEQSLRSHQQSARVLAANSSRIAELEQARQGDRRKLSQLEQQYKDQLAERNSVLLTIWKRLSSMCGPDWAHNHSLINGNLPSQEVIGNILFWPGFSRNILLASKQVEGALSSFRDRIKKVERELYKEYQSLEHTLELRTKKLERVEDAWEKMKVHQAAVDSQARYKESRSSKSPGSGSHRTSDLQKLRGENRLLKAELSLLQQQHSNAHFRSRSSGLSPDNASGNSNGGIPLRGSSIRSPQRGYGNGDNHGRLMRQHSTNVVEHPASTSLGGDGSGRSLRSNSMSSSTSASLAQQRPLNTQLMLPIGPQNIPHNGNFAAPPSNAGSEHSSVNTAVLAAAGGQVAQEKWIHRLRELERRLKAEREARLLDRSGARRRLEERDAVNEELRRELERERFRRSEEEERDRDRDHNRLAELQGDHPDERSE